MEASKAIVRHLRVPRHAANEASPASSGEVFVARRPRRRHLQHGHEHPERQGTTGARAATRY